MVHPAITLQANLIDGNNYIPVKATYLSKFSINIHFLNGKSFPNGFIFSRFKLNLNGDSISLGPCKLLKEPENNGKNGKLVFIKDVYDLENLFYKKTIVKLHTSFINVPLIIRHKEKIKDDFRAYTSNLTYDLSIYKNLFDQIDNQIDSELENVKKNVRKTVIETEGRKFMSFLDYKLDTLEKLVSDYTDEEHQYHGFYFRKQLWHIIKCSPFMIRTNIKPRGYAGDFEMMKMIYDNDYNGHSTFGMILHKHSVEHPAAVAVRTRRKLISQTFSKIKKSANKTDKRKIEILSVACGPFYELQDIIDNAKDTFHYNFTLLDQDQLALDTAKKIKEKKEKEFSVKLNVKFLNESVRTMLTTKKIADKWGKFNFIYSMGLFDYLTPPVARVVLRKLIQLLAPKGEMVIGNFHVSNPSKLYMEYWHDWVLYYRTEDEFLELLNSDKSVTGSVYFENTGSQMFLHLKKNN
jgi:extracellular factor (EF) 3-hydroxypalmitic acid methyl ester biosynthesis protein